VHEKGVADLSKDFLLEWYLPDLPIASSKVSHARLFPCPARRGGDGLTFGPAIGAIFLIEATLEVSVDFGVAETCYTCSKLLEQAGVLARSPG
jgi:hypothetical protein